MMIVYDFQDFRVIVEPLFPDLKKLFPFRDSKMISKTRIQNKILPRIIES
jgi:hypothetical protein